MKKKLFLILSIMVFSCVNVLSQNDGFFTYRNVEDRESSSAWINNAPDFPTGHGYNDDQSSLPLGNGVLLLGGLALAYGIRRKSKVEN